MPNHDPLQPWAILPSYAQHVLTLMEADEPQQPAACEPVLFSEWGEPLAANSTTTGSMIAVLPLSGPVSPRGEYGGTSLDQFTRVVQQLDNNPNVSAIVLDVSSPGGTVTGTLEAADAVRAVRDRGNTQIVSVANGMMASAATWIGTAAEEVYVTKSGQAGSIGVIAMYADASEAYENMGVKISVMRTPEKKARFSGVEPLTDEMRQHMESLIGSSYQKFLRAMADNRKVRVDSVESRFGGGEMMDAGAANEAGLVDRIGSLDDAIARVAKQKRKAPGAIRAEIDIAEFAAE